MFAKKNFLFTSESVCAGHPDKICDQISDAILDEVLKKDPYGRVAVETLVTKNRAVIVGEVTANAKINYGDVARTQIKRLGYIKNIFDFSDLSPIEIYIHEQSQEIAVGVDNKGAGDQGMMFGYACRQTKGLMPLPIVLAHKLARILDQTRETKKIPYLYPDGKTQVTLEYKDGKPHKIRKIVIAVPHEEKIDFNQVKSDVFKNVVLPVVESFGLSTKEDDFILNGTGVWHKGGPASDSGLTGRKIVVDTYGGYVRVGGGCFSGKDPTKVDRSGAYAARFIAKNIVANNLADEVEIGLAYFIGAKKPVMFEIETFGTSKKPDQVIKDFSEKILDCSVEGILRGLSLRKPIYLPTASYGHFGREEFPWEKIV